MSVKPATFWRQRVALMLSFVISVLYLSKLADRIQLTHISLVSLVWGMDKKYNCDTAARGTTSGGMLFA